MHELVACVHVRCVWVDSPHMLLNPSFTVIILDYYPTLPLDHQPVRSALHTIALRLQKDLVHGW
jgi:hypothetical protein